MIANAWAKKENGEPFEIKDFLLRFWGEGEPGHQTGQDFKAFFMGLTKAMGGKIE